MESELSDLKLAKVPNTKPKSWIRLVLKERSDFVLVKDRDERWVVLSNSPWSLDYAVQQASGLELLDISPLDDRDLPK